MTARLNILRGWWLKTRCNRSRPVSRNLPNIMDMQRYRGRTGQDLTDGPAKLCQALAINKALNGWDLTAGRKLWVEAQPAIPEPFIKKGPRIGIDYAKSSDRRAARRFWMEEKYIREMSST